MSPLGDDTPAAGPGWGDRPAVHIVVPPRGAAARRRLGLVLAVFGGIGVLLFGVALAFVAGPVDEDQGPLGLEGQRRQLVAMLDASSSAIADAETAAATVDGSLGSTAEAAGSASTLMNELATTMRGLAGSLRNSPLGGALSGPADDFDRVAEQAASVAADLDEAAGSVEVAGGDIAALARNLGEMRTELGRIRTSIAGRIEADGWRLVLGAMLAWLSVPALACLALGIRWLRPAPATPHAERGASR